MKIRFTQYLLAALLGVTFTTELHAQLPNAWQIDDHTNTASLFYNAILATNAQQAATNAGFDFRVNARFVTDYGQGNRTMFMIYGDGTTRWEVLWSLNNGDLQSYLYSGGGTHLVTANGTGTNLYHTHEIIYDPTNHTASYLVDGQVLATNWMGSTATWPAGEVAWGGAGTAGEGAMNFHTVSFVVSNSEVAAYNAGTEPSNAPAPESQGWSLSPSSPSAGTSTNAISSDPAPIPTIPLAATQDATNVGPYQAILTGVVNPGGLLTLAWFEWGTDTNYGNITPPQVLLSDTNNFNLVENLTDLTKGTTYHFRCVATNLEGIAYGADGVFTTTTPQVFLVTNLADSGAGTLRQAIASASAEDTIAFALNGAITLTSGELLITNNLSITGPGPTQVSISGNNSSRIFQISGNNVTVSISGLTLTDGRAGFGGGILNVGTLTLSNVVLFGNAATDSGGAIATLFGSLDLHSCTLADNFATNDGGGIYIQQSVSHLVDSTVAGNSAGNNGGGIYNYGNYGSLMVATNSTISGNSAGDQGGGIYSYIATNILDHCSLTVNSAYNGGGGFAAVFSSLSTTQSDFSGNFLTSSNFNTFGGGGIFITQSVATIVASSVTNNTVTRFGAGIFNGGGWLLLSNSTVADNLILDVGNFAYGGGIYNDGGTNIIEGSTISGNVCPVPYYGGGFYNDLGIVTMLNSTVVGNSAGLGGGMDVNSGAMSLTHCTVTANSAYAIGGIFNAVAKPVLLTNTIVAGNTDTSGDLDISGDFEGVNNLTNGIPLLTPLGNYGGPTQTMPPLFGSPVIDAGSDLATNFLATDQRGYPRKAGSHVDIGAVEAQYAPANNPPQLTGSTFSTVGGTSTFQFSFTNSANVDFTALTSTNVALPLNNWTILGNAIQVTPGVYQFTDPGATNDPQRFYWVVSP